MPRPLAVRLVPAFALVALIVALAPFMGRVRDVLFERFGGDAVRGLALALGLTAAGLLIYAVARIRRNRLWRYAGLLATLVLLALQEKLLGAGMPAGEAAARVSVAERIHIVEYGLLAWLLYRALRPAGDPTMLLVPLLGVLIAGTLDEGVQWLVETRLGEVRDVFLNLYAGLCGLVFALSLRPPERFRWRLDARGRRLVATLGAAAVLAVGLFFAEAHLGYEHHDPEVGRFRSWHTLDELRAARADRLERWRRDPPTGLSPWRREDLFLTEAGWHAHYRNASYHGGHLAAALQENRILEKYYGPFLDLESFRGSGKNRYPPELRRRLETEATVDPATYRSPVLTERIHLWPKTPFLALVFVTAGVIWLPPRLFRRRE